MSNNSAISRLKKEYTRIQKLEGGDCKFIVCPDEKNFLNWHFLLHNLEGPYAGGVYHGELKFPIDYPFKPPSLLFHTPSGRFGIGVKVCLSFTSFHPETWNPYWRVESMIESIIIFMYTTEQTTGGINLSDSSKRNMAKESLKFNLESNPEYKRIFKKINLKTSQIQKSNSPENFTKTSNSSPSTKDKWLIVNGVDCSKILIASIVIGISFGALSLTW